MGVIAWKLITESGDTFYVEHEFECGTFDAQQETGAGWTEIERDCDRWVNRRTLWPYASGMRYGAPVRIVKSAANRKRKYFPAVGDEFTTELDMSDVNNGIMPANYCAYLELMQNGKVIPCEGFTIDHPNKKILINAAWRVPGAAYEVTFWV